MNDLIFQFCGNPFSVADNVKALVKIRDWTLARKEMCSVVCVICKNWIRCCRMAFLCIFMYFNFKRNKPALCELKLFLRSS